MIAPNFDPLFYGINVNKDTMKYNNNTTIHAKLTTQNEKKITVLLGHCSWHQLGTD